MAAFGISITNINPGMLHVEMYSGRFSFESLSNCDCVHFWAHNIILLCLIF